MSTLGNRLLELYWAQQQKNKQEPYYEVLEYIETSNTQYWDTDIIPSSDLKIDITYQSDVVTSNGCCFGARDSATGTGRHMFSFWQTTATNMRADLGDHVGSSIGKANTNWKNVVKDGFHNYIDGNEVTQNNESTFEAYAQSATITIGCMQQGSTSIERIYCIQLKIAQCKVWKNGVQIRDYVPVLDFQLRPCLYDKIHKQFTYARNFSDATTTYDVTYKRWNKYTVDYLESSGTQYIDTGVLLDTPTAIVNSTIDFKVLTEDSGSSIIAGAITTSGSGYYTNTQALTYQNGFFSNGGFTYTQRDITARTVATANGRGSAEPNINVLLFARNRPTLGAQILGTCRIYSAVLYSHGTLVRSFVPTVYDSKACMYDECYNKMYYNAGTGSFKAGIEQADNLNTELFTSVGSTDGYYINANGVITHNTASAYTALIPITPLQPITCTKTDTSPNIYRYHMYTQNGDWIQQIATMSDTTTSITFIPPSNARYLRVSLPNNKLDDVSVKYAYDYEVGASLISSGTQYIDLGYPIDGTMSFEVKSRCLAAGFLFGGREAVANKVSGFNYDTQGSRVGARMGGVILYDDSRWTANTDYLISIFNGRTMLNDTVVATTAYGDDYYSGNAYLYTVNNNGSIGSTSYNKNLVYFFKMYKRKKVSQMLVPVKTGNIVGMFDLVKREFYPNAGSDAFSFNSLT